MDRSKRRESRKFLACSGRIAEDVLDPLTLRLRLATSTLGADATNVLVDARGPSINLTHVGVPEHTFQRVQHVDRPPALSL